MSKAKDRGQTALFGKTNFKKEIKLYVNSLPPQEKNVIDSEV